MVVMGAMVVTAATAAGLATTMLAIVVMEAMESMAAMVVTVHVVASETFMAELWKLFRAEGDECPNHKHDGRWIPLFGF